MNKAFYLNKEICRGEDLDPALTQWMDDNQYWPNTWWVSDHGNIHHYHIDGHKYNCNQNSNLCPDHEEEGSEEDIYIQ